MSLLAIVTSAGVHKVAVMMLGDVPSAIYMKTIGLI